MEDDSSEEELFEPSDKVRIIRFEIPGGLRMMRYLVCTFKILSNRMLRFSNVFPNIKLRASLVDC